MCERQRVGGADLFAMLPNPGSITHQHHLSPFTCGVSCLGWYWWEGLGWGGVVGV